MDEKYYSIKDISTTLKVTYLTVYRWIKSGKLKANQIQKQYRISETNLNAFINKK